MDPSKAVPWQVEWKRPRWNQISSKGGSAKGDDDVVVEKKQQGNHSPTTATATATATATTNNNNNIHNTNSIIVGSASSQVDLDELPATSVVYSELVAASAAATESLMLTVTLLSRQPVNQMKKDAHSTTTTAAAAVASELLLELHSLPATTLDNNDNVTNDDETNDDDDGDENKQDSSKSSSSSSSSSSRLLASKRLQWPEAVFDDAITTQDEIIMVDQESEEKKEDDDDDEDDDDENENEKDDNNHDTAKESSKGGGTSLSSSPKKNKNALSKLQDWFTLSPLMGKLERKSKAEQQAFLGNHNPNGLLSAVLIRRPKQQNGGANANAGGTKEDVMDTIALMSLGMAAGNNATAPFGQQQQQQKQQVDGASASPSKKEKMPSSTSGNDENRTSRKQKDDNGKDESDNEENEKDTALPDLYLACMTVRGLVAIYSPWTLLQLEEMKAPTSSNTTETNEVRKKKNIEFVDSLATLFLGQEIFAALEQSWKPLSEPLSTISLSILEQNQVYKQRRKRRRALDVSLWNHLVESATIPHRTVANRAQTLAVAGPSYLAVFGSGIPYTQVFRHDDESTMGGDPTHLQSVEHQQMEDDDGWWDQQQQQQQQQQDGKRKSEEVAFLRPRIDSNGSNWSQENDDDGSVPKVELISGPIQEWVRRDSDLDENADKENEDEAKANKKLKKWWQRKGSSADTDDLPLSLSTGGFITFCSVSQWSETRTLFLPFVPKQISYIPEWNSMEIVLVMGQTQAIAVRLDSSQVPVVIGNVTDQLQRSVVDSIDDSLGAQTPVKNENYMNIKRFQVLPIAIPHSTVSSCILCGSAPGVQPPSLLQLFTEETHHGLVLQKSLKGITALGTIELSYAPSDVAKIHVGETESLSSSWSVLGQGWSLLGTNENVYFICWEGATVAGGVALVHVLDASPVLASSLPTCVDFVSQRRPYIADRAFEIKTDLMGPYESFETKDITNEATEKDAIDRIVVEAMESVSGFSSRSQIEDDDEINRESHGLSEEMQLSSREKSVRLLSRCSSWTRLEHTLDKMERQVHIVSLRSGNAQSPQYTFTLRQLFVENGSTSPFHQVLSWLADRGDYFTASSIALSLLQDVETLYHLWTTSDKIDNTEEQNMLEGLLDGIEPIEEFEDENGTPSPATVQLADMTVGCLAKGGFEMSSTLEKFLRENKLYDPPRACLMLVSTTAKALSDHYEKTASSNNSVEELLWPVRSLLEAGVARDCLPTALLLLNSTIPDELRGREQESGIAMIDVTTALISAIVASDKNAAELLLDLIDGTSNQKYWQSLDHQTQLVLSLTFVSGGYPLLRHREIRSWTRDRLHSCVADEASPETQDLPSEWLKKLVSACLSNAGCDQDEFDTGTPNEIEKGSMDFEDSVDHHRRRMLKYRKSLTPVRGRVGVDFDLLVPCLLILHRRRIQWNGDDSDQTQSLLDAACYVAGRHSNDQFAFAFDSSTVMKQCAIAGNVRAAAKLIGGANGFVLHCSDILIKQLGVSMKDAEAFLLNDALSADFLDSSGGKDDFQLGEAHRYLLLLLDEHILTIQTYGEFDTVHIRGRVDPVFSSRSILRSWLCISYGDKINSVDWLVKYLRKRLRMDGDEGRSPYRLPCAALCRSLFWAKGGGTNDSLSVQMGMDITFLVHLALSCCGLVESIPLSIAKEISAKAEKPKLYSMPQVQFPSASRLK
ncbi:unnamed protein product [Cylindrotheca closterium]|uniref:Uncharacterized protein n=1 Tax=Cylindrotheca closterium TaxID=2856 RepID=A0AAD2JNY9_9STRA|nr:unnamed protein product [Cylindrotheca closterium]